MGLENEGVVAFDRVELVDRPGSFRLGDHLPPHLIRFDPEGAPFADQHHHAVVGGLVLVHRVVDHHVTVTSDDVDRVLDVDPGKRQVIAVGGDPCHRPHHPFDEVHHVRQPVLDHSTPGRPVGVVDFSISGAVVRKMLSRDGDDFQRAAVVARENLLADGGEQWVGSQDVGHRELSAFGRYQFAQPVSVLQGCGERFLAQHGDAGFQEFHGHRDVQMGRRADDRDVGRPL